MSQSSAGQTILSNTVDIGATNSSAFGDLIAVSNTPLIQLDFVHGINTQTGVSAVENSAVADTDASRLRLQSGTNAGGSATFTSARPAKYRPGQGITARFTTAFTAGVASSTQIAGMGNTIDGYFVGFNGTSFGILHRVRSADTWVAQASFNGDKLDGTGSTGFTINATLGNVWQIRYPYLGYGAITFWCLDPNGTWLLAHTIRYPNTSAATQLSNPNLSFYAQSINAGATTNQVVYVGSVGVFLSGDQSFVTSPKWAVDATKNSVSAEAAILSIRNATTYNGSPNRGLLRLNELSVNSAAGNNSLNIFRLRIGATLGGSPSYATVNGTTGDEGVTITSGNSSASVDTAATTATGGLLVFNITCANNSNMALDLTPFQIFVAPGQVLTISAFSTVSSNHGVAINWSEDI